MSITLISHISGVNTGILDITGANVLIGAVSSFGSGGTISDFYGNPWSPLTLWGLSNNSVRLYYCFNPNTSGTNTDTFTAGGGAPSLAVAAFQFSGTPSFDSPNENGLGGSTSSPIATGAITPSAGGALIISGAAWDKAADPISVDSGLTVIEDFDWSVGVNEGVSIAWLVQTSAAAINPNWTRAQGVGFPFSAGVAAFLNSASGPTVDQLLPAFMQPQSQPTSHYKVSMVPSGARTGR